MKIASSSVNHSDVARAVERWFPRVGRPLPWRRRRSRWRTFVSEIMLQQTQVTRVVEKFEPFLSRFPTPRALAEAPESDVLTYWAGLGYYRRARFLHAAARTICDQYGGRVPVDPDVLQTLPGVGRYTAGAIASIAGGRAAPIVDGNVHRVLTRLWADPVAADDRAGVQRTWQRATGLVECARSPGCFNEGLMELGALICTPRSPSCEACPLQKLCVANRSGLVEQIPPPKQKAAQATEFHYALALIRRGRLGMHQRPARGKWAGLWQLPTVESAHTLEIDDLRARFTQELGRPVASLEMKGEFHRVLTHRQITFTVFGGRLGPGRLRPGAGIRWIPRDFDLPLGVPQAQSLQIAGWSAPVPVGVTEAVRKNRASRQN